MNPIFQHIKEVTIIPPPVYADSNCSVTGDFKEPVLESVIINLVFVSDYPYFYLHITSMLVLIGLGYLHIEK